MNNMQGPNKGMGKVMDIFSCLDEGMGFHAPQAEIDFVGHIFLYAGNTYKSGKHHTLVTHNTKLRAPGKMEGSH